jgi:dUTP diphosphatase
MKSGQQVLPIRIKRLKHSKGLQLPAYQTDGSAGMDLCAAIDREISIQPGKTAIVPCGFALSIPFGFEGQVRPRSGLAAKNYLTVLNTPGTIDSDYRGEVKVQLYNAGSHVVSIRRGMRIAQMIVSPICIVKWLEVDRLSTTARRTRGYGHTGK